MRGDGVVVIKGCVEIKSPAGHGLVTVFITTRIGTEGHGVSAVCSVRELKSERNGNGFSILGSDERSADRAPLSRGSARGTSLIEDGKVWPDDFSCRLFSRVGGQKPKDPGRRAQCHRKSIG